MALYKTRVYDSSLKPKPVKLKTCTRCNGAKGSYNTHIKQYVDCKLCGGIGKV